MPWEGRADEPVTGRLSGVAAAVARGRHARVLRGRAGSLGDSDGDLEILQWTTTGEGPRFGLIVHHTDGARERAYDRPSGIGRLDEALDEAESSGWTVLDMARDWRVVCAPSTP